MPPNLVERTYYNQVDGAREAAARMMAWVDAEVALGMQLIPILLSIVTTLYIGSGPVDRAIYTIYWAQTSKTAGSDTSTIVLTSTPKGE